MDKRTFGTFLTALRKANGMTQKDLAERLCVSDKAVSRWERDETFPDPSLLPVIGDTFGVTVDELLRGGKTSEENREGTASGSRRTESQVRNLAEKIQFHFLTAALICIGSVMLACIFRMVFYDLSVTMNALTEGTAIGVWLAAIIFVSLYYISCRSKLSGMEDYEETLASGRKKLLSRLRWTILVLLAFVPIVFIIEIGWAAFILSLLIIGIPCLIGFFGWLVNSGN